MSNKSARPVKTHEEKLVDKAKRAIEEFWPPESDKNSESTKLKKEQSNQETEDTEKHVASKKQPLADEDLKNKKSVKAKTNSIRKTKD